MDEIPNSVFNSASAALSLLSKARCVESYSFPSDRKWKQLFAWPSTLERDTDTINWLKAKNFRLYDNLRVKSYRVGYQEYESYKEIKINDNYRIRISRDILGSLKICQNREALLGIYATWDMEEYPDRVSPNNTSDIEALKHFAEFNDAMYAFELSGQQHYVKLPAYIYEALFLELGLFKDLKITHRDRRESVSNKSDHKGRADRYVVHEGNKKYLNNVLRATSESIEYLSSSAPWVQKLIESGEQFHANKAY